MDCNTELTDAHVQSLYELLRQVPDSRHPRGRRYEAATVLVILLLAKLAGESTISGIAHWAKLRETWLKAALGLKRLPCANKKSLHETQGFAASLTCAVREHR